MYASRLCEKLLAIGSTSKSIIIFLPEQYVEQVRDMASPTSQTAGRSISRVEVEVDTAARLMVLAHAEVVDMGN